MDPSEENRGAEKPFGREKNKAESKKNELIRRIKLWKEKPNPWQVLGCITLLDEEDQPVVFPKMYFTALEAVYIYENVGVEYRLPLLFYLILDEVFLKHNLEWVNKKVYSLDKASKGVQDSIIVLQMKTRIEKHKKQEIADGKEKTIERLISAYRNGEVIRCRNRGI